MIFPPSPYGFDVILEDIVSKVGDERFEFQLRGGILFKQVVAGNFDTTPFAVAATNVLNDDLISELKYAEYFSTQDVENIGMATKRAQKFITIDSNNPYLQLAFYAIQLIFDEYKHEAAQYLKHLPWHQIMNEPAGELLLNISAKQSEISNQDQFDVQTVNELLPFFALHAAANQDKANTAYAALSGCFRDQALMSKKGDGYVSDSFMSFKTCPFSKFIGQIMAFDFEEQEDGTIILRDAPRHGALIPFLIGQIQDKIHLNPDLNTSVQKWANEDTPEYGALTAALLG